MAERMPGARAQDGPPVVALVTISIPLEGVAVDAPEAAKLEAAVDAAGVLVDDYAAEVAVHVHGAKRALRFCTPGHPGVVPK